MFHELLSRDRGKGCATGLDDRHLILHYSYKIMLTAREAVSDRVLTMMW